VTGLTVGVDVGGSKVLAVLADAEGAVHAEARHATPPHEDAPGVVVADTVAGAIDDLAREAGRALDGLPVGVGLPGMLDRDGVLAVSPNLPSASGADMAAVLAARLGGRAVVLANDADAAAPGRAPRGWGAPGRGRRGGGGARDAGRRDRCVAARGGRSAGPRLAGR